MIQLTPRSYIFNGLEITRDALIPFIGQILRKNKQKTWWFDLVYSKLIEEHKHITRSGNTNDLYVQLDELLCIKIIEYNETLFKKHINISLVKKLHEIRNTCAHIFKKGGIIDKQYAENALKVMANLLDSVNMESKGRILELKNQMDIQIFNRKPVIASREALISLLNEKIWKPSFDLLNNITDLDAMEKEKIQNGMKEAINALEQNATNKDVLEWFKYHLYSKEGIETYNKLKNIREVNMPTFEDIRLDFLQLCYGEL